VTEEEMRKRLEGLRLEHRDLDVAIEALSANGVADQLQVARLKKRKLLLKDQIDAGRLSDSRYYRLKSTL
jgi:hypothetical protein